MRGVLLRIVLAILTIYHLGIGVVSVLSADLTARFAKWFYGLDAEVGPAFVYMLKALGMYAIFTGILSAVCFIDPRRYRAVGIALVVLLVLRCLTRVLAYDTLEAAFGVSWTRNLTNVALMLLWAAVIVVCLPREATASEPATTTDADPPTA